MLVLSGPALGHLFLIFAKKRSSENQNSDGACTHPPPSRSHEEGWNGFVHRAASRSLLHGKGDNQEEEREEEKTKRRIKRTEYAPVFPRSSVTSPQALVTPVIFLCLDIFDSCKHTRRKEGIGVIAARYNIYLFVSWSSLHSLPFVVWACQESNGQLFNLWIFLFSNVGINWIYIYFESKQNFKNIQLLISQFRDQKHRVNQTVIKMSLLS